MTITLLQLVSAINDANMLVQAASPLVAQARAAGLGDDHVFTDEELDDHAVRVGADIKALRAAIAKAGADATPITPSA